MSKIKIKRKYYALPTLVLDFLLILCTKCTAIAGKQNSGLTPLFSMSTIRIPPQRGWGEGRDRADCQGLIPGDIFLH